MTDRPTFPTFPTGFVWGVSTSAYQIEGAIDAGGRGPSTWDTFSAQTGRIADGSSGAVSTDHYHRYREDVALMRDLGVTAYRFSLAWSRIQPTGSGPANPAGLDFYDRLIDELCAASMTPAPTLYHWDTPQPLEDAGGWLNRDITDRFADYAQILGQRFADRVPIWVTINEPVVLTTLGYGQGIHAPGRKLGLDALPAAHHQLLAHGRAVQALRAAGASNIGIANSHLPASPATDSAADREAARQFNASQNWLYSDPLITGEYPDDYADAMPGPVADDLTVIAAPIDWYGVNYYYSTRVAANPSTGGGDTEAAPYEFVPVVAEPRTDLDWPIVPDGFRDLLQRLADRYGAKLPAVYITENGCAINDQPDTEGRVADQRRIDYLDSHLRAVHTAMEAGVDVRGYFQWSLLDNFEWAEGYVPRFGLIHVDYQTLKRTPKDSYHWYREVIGANT